MILYWLVIAVPPAVLLMIRPRAAKVMVPTIAATWLSTAIALDNFSSDDISAIILFAFILLPMLAAAVGMVSAVVFAPKPRMWFDAGFLAIIGWWLGMLVVFFVPPPGFAAVGRAPSLWVAAMILAAPGIWAGAGAGFGATNKPAS